MTEPIVSSTTTSNARLAHIDLIPSSFVSHSVSGSFSAPDLHDEIAIARIDVIELVRIVDNQSWKVIHREPVFGTVRAMACLPSPSRATQQDCLVVTSDSGCISLLKFNPTEHRFEVESEDFFGRSGIRRTVPGHYLAVEPASTSSASSSSAAGKTSAAGAASAMGGGRAIMVSALESMKLLYPVHHLADAATGNIKTILLSPIEINRPASVTFSLVALQEASSSSSSILSSSSTVRFASIESEKGLGIRQVVIYEYDASLQNCSAVLSIPVVATASPSALIPLAGNNNLGCPLGALIVVCSPGDEQIHTLLLQQNNNEKNNNNNNTTDASSASSSSSSITYEQISSCVPRRIELSPKDSAMFITGTYAQVRTRGIFTLIQNELGDLYKVELAAIKNQQQQAAKQSGGGGVLDDVVVAAVKTPSVKLHVRYFDTLPSSLVAQSAVLLRTGAFAVFGENGSNGIYRVTGLGPQDDSYIVKTFNVKTIVKTRRSDQEQQQQQDSATSGALLPVPEPQHIITREVKQFVASPNKLRYLQPVLGAMCNGGGGATSCPTMQMTLFPNSILSNLMVASGGGDRNNNNQQQASSSSLQNSTKKFMTVRGKGFDNSSVSLVQFGHRADVVAEYNLPFSFEQAIVLPRSQVFLLSSRSNDATLVFSSEKFEVLNSLNNHNQNESNPTGFVSNACTIDALELPDKGGIIQVHSNGMRHISSSSSSNSSASSSNQQHQQHHDWAHQSGRKISLAASNSAGQLLLSFVGGSGLMLFEYDRQVGAMRIESVSDKMQDISCLAVAPPLSSSSKAVLGAVGLGGNFKRLIFVWLVTTPTVGTTTAMKHPQKALQPATEPLGFDTAPVSVSFVRMGTVNTLFAVVGLEDGTVVRIPIDGQTAHIKDGVLEDLTEIGCGEGPAKLVSSSSSDQQTSSSSTTTTQDDSSLSTSSKCCYAVSSGNIWRLSVQDRETHTQVPVSISSSSSAITDGASSLSVCPLKTTKLPNGLLILNPAQNILAAATIDATSNFNETTLKRPSLSSSLMNTSNNNNKDGKEFSFSCAKMIRRMMLSRDGNVGVVLENENRSKANIVQSLTKHNAIMSRIRQRESLLEDAGKNNTNNDDDDEFAPTQAATAAKKENENPPITTDILKQQPYTSSVTSSWCLETFSVPDSLSNAAGKSSSGGGDSSELSFASNKQQIFEPVSPNESATAMVVGTIRSGSVYLTTNSGSTGDSMMTNTENIVVSVTQQQHHQNNIHSVSSLLYTFSMNYSGNLTLLHKTVVNSFNLDESKNDEEDPLNDYKSLLATALSNTTTSLHILPNSHWLIAANGKSLSFYGLGKEQLIRKHFVAEAVPNKISAICSSDEEILCVADVHDSVFLYKIGNYQQQPTQQFGSNNNNNKTDRPIAVLFADDFIPRHVTCCTFVDPSTVAVGDRFGNISIVRFTYEAVAYANIVLTAAINSSRNNNSNSDPSTSLIAVSADAKRLKGAPKKVEEIARFFVGQTIVSIDREYQITTSAAASIRNEIIPLYYCTSIGKIGALLPISQDDFQHLTRVERVLRDWSTTPDQQQQQETTNEDGSTTTASSTVLNNNNNNKYRPLLGRDHCAYRSSFGPCIGVVDVSFIEQVWRIAKQRAANNQASIKKNAYCQDDVEEIIDSLVLEAQMRNESVGLTSVGARPLETGLSELHARAIGNVES